MIILFLIIILRRGASASILSLFFSDIFIFSECMWSQGNGIIETSEIWNCIYGFSITSVHPNLYLVKCHLIFLSGLNLSSKLTTIPHMDVVTINRKKFPYKNKCYALSKTKGIAPRWGKFQRIFKIKQAELKVNTTTTMVLFPGGSVINNLAANEGDAGDMGSIPPLGRSPRGGNGNPLQRPCLGNPMERKAW